MTIKKLYEYAKENGYENAPVIVSYICSDDWYSCHDEIEKENVEFADNTINIMVGD